MAENLKYVPIKDIKGGESVLSLDEETGKTVPARIKGLLDMGVQPVYKLTTEDGPTIRTTGNHPYLVLNQIVFEDSLSLISNPNSETRNDLPENSSLGTTDNNFSMRDICLESEGGCTAKTAIPSYFSGGYKIHLKNLDHG